MRSPMPDWLKGIVSEHALTWRIVFWVIVPLVRLGLIDCFGCVLLAGLIGGVVTCFSNRSPTRQHPPVG